ncbi:MAG TPA: heme-binding domain-containing protein [Pyrinomonadaceae bacterium]|jgi:hypothetical protein|nr:heme-binding domain-containing protein [Pyrinomonadaceae bacterium]
MKLPVKKIVKVAAVVIVVLFVLIQFVRPDRNNPPINPAETLEASVQVPENVKTVLARSCADCHSNETYYPWYSNISPVSWFLANHIEDGRRELNMSVWSTYSDKKKAKKLEEVCEQVMENEMPLPSYLWIHRDAGLSDPERGLLCDWANAERTKIPQ